MMGRGVIQSVQFVTVDGKRLAVLSAEDWLALVEWVESLEDIEAPREALAELTAAGGDRGRGGWLEWEAATEDVRRPRTVSSPRR
jgi:hypothetical protein